MGSRVTNFDAIKYGISLLYVYMAQPVVKVNLGLAIPFLIRIIKLLYDGSPHGFVCHIHGYEAWGKHCPIFVSGIGTPFRNGGRIYP